MPAPAKPKPPPPAPPQPVQSAGKQKHFQEPARLLAEKLGWSGDPDWIANDIRVEDAENFITKVMHEHFQAAAKGLPQPSYLDACEHLAVDNPGEQSAIDKALAAVYELGKGAHVTSHPATTADMQADVTGSAAVMLSNMNKAGG